MIRKPEKGRVAGSDPSPRASTIRYQGLREGSGRVRDAALGDDPVRQEIAAHYLMDEAQLMRGLVQRAVFTGDERSRIAALATRLVEAARRNRDKHGGVDAFMREYGLSSEEGIILMCLAEALLRIPDADTADRLIAEKIGSGQWERHLGRSDSLFVNASTFGLMLTGKVVRLGLDKGTGPGAVLKRLVSRSGEPVIRQALRRAMRVLGDSFVLGQTIEAALERAAPLAAKGYRFSFDMLGERARTEKDAERYFGRYMAAIDAVGRAHPTARELLPHELPARPSISVKLSALHPRFDPGKDARLAVELAAAARRSSPLPRAAAVWGSPSTPRSRTASMSRSTSSPRPSALRRSRAGRASASRCRPTASARSRCCAGCAGWRRRRASRSRCASSRAPTGTARSSGRRSAASTTTPC